MLLAKLTLPNGGDPQQKAIHQLKGVLPVGAYKVAVTIDLNSVTRTGAPDIKKIITSVVVDDQYDEVELNEQSVEDITQAVAGAVGYIDGRDKVHVSRASFLPKRKVEIISEEEPESKRVVLPSDSFSEKVKSFLK